LENWLWLVYIRVELSKTIILSSRL